MNKLNKYLKGLLEQEFDRVRKVPDFKTSEAAQSFVDRLKEFDRVEDDVIDPETGEVLLEKGETKKEAGGRNTAAQKRHQRQMKKVGFGSYLSRAKKSKADDELKEPENKENPDEAFDLTIKEVADHFKAMGKDMAGDWLYDNKGKDDEDGFNFNQWVDSAAGDAANSIYNAGDPEDKRMFKYLKAIGVRDIEGWLADEIADGMREERGPDDVAVGKMTKKKPTKADREKKLRNNRWGRIMGDSEE